MARELIQSYWQWFADLVHPHHEVIAALSMAVIAVLTIVLAYLAWRLTRDARILQRAYLDVQFGGIRNNTAGELVGHVTFKNVGHLPAHKFCWVVNLGAGGKDWKPPKIKNRDLDGESVIPIGAEWPKGSAPLAHPQEEQRGLYLYVWGRVTYKDGYKWRKRYTDFCHRYPWEKRETPASGGVAISTDEARYNVYGNRAT
jgi:hypothetical protein